MGEHGLVKSAPWETPTSPQATAPPLYDPARRSFRGPDPSTAPQPAPAIVREESAAPTRVLLWVLLASVMSAAMAIGISSLLSDDQGTDQIVSLGTGGTPAEAGTNLDLLGESLDVQGVLARVQESVVTIETNQESDFGIFGAGAGSGFVISDDGLVLTNDHVVAGSDIINVTFFNGLTFEADIVGRSANDDIALLQVRGVADTMAADLGSVETLRVGDQVLAIGNALGFGGEPTVTLGIVSAKNRDLGPGFPGSGELIQTDAAINPGNSGGPLVNAAGQVVGINTAIIEGAQSLGFAISIDSVMDLIERLEGRDPNLTPEMAFFGASSVQLAEVPPATRRENSIVSESGAFVVDVIPNSAADRAGIEVGDLITSVDGRPVASPEEVARIVRGLDPDDSMRLALERNGVSGDVSVQLGSRTDAGN